MNKVVSNASNKELCISVGEYKMTNNTIDYQTLILTLIFESMAIV